LGFRRDSIDETARLYRISSRRRRGAFDILAPVSQRGADAHADGWPPEQRVAPIVPTRGQDAAAVDALLVGAKSVVDKVLILRHEAFHRSAHISYNDVFTMAAVKPDELRDLTDKALNIANRLLLARGLEDQYFTELPREAAEAMMKALRVKGP
jgi:hypothetical protein